jgi:uncharacterized RmlC-like cupin family protein
MVISNNLSRSEIKQMSRDIVEENGQLINKITDDIHLLVYKMYREGGDVPYHAIHKLKLGMPLELASSGTTTVKKIVNSQKTCEFIVNMSPKATLYRHRHDDSFETIEVISDSKVKIITGAESTDNLSIQILSKGEIMLIPAGMPHQVNNLSDSELILTVKFTKV